MPEEARGRWIHPDKIKEQGKKGWVDFHPEDYCHLCGMRNFSWSTDSDEWNKVDPTRVSILCVYCFTEGWAAVHPAERGGWELRSTRAIYKDERRTALLREVRIALNDHRCGFGVVFGDEDGDAALLTKIDEALPKDDTERPRHG